MRLDPNMSRKIAALAMAAAAAAALSVGAFAAGDDGVVAGYLPPQEPDGAGRHCPATPRRARPRRWRKATAATVPPRAIPFRATLCSLPRVPQRRRRARKCLWLRALTLTGLFRKSVLFTARQDGQVLTLDAPASSAVVRGTIGDLRAQMQQGVGTLCVKTDKRTTTLNLALMCEGYADNTRFTLRTVGDHAYLTIGLRSRRDLLIGR